MFQLFAVCILAFLGAPSPGAAGSVPTPLREAADLKDEAIGVARAVAATYPKEPLAHALLGSAYYNTGRSDEAIKHIQKCIELQPNQVDAHEILARIAYEKGDPEEAVRIAEKALKLAPENPELLNRMGRSLLDLGRSEEAVAHLQKAAGLSRAGSESWHLLGQAQMQTGDYPSAKLSFLKAVHLLPEHTQAYFGLFTACLRLDQPEEAARFREKFQALEQADREELKRKNAQEDTRSGIALVRQTVSRSLFGAAQIYRAHGEPGKAAEFLLKTARLDPENPAPRAALEDLYVKRSENAAGLRAFEGLAAEQPTNSMNYLYVGRMQNRMNNFDEAERAFLKVQELDPKWHEGYRALAELYLRTSQKPEQLEGLRRKALELDPTGSQYYNLALALLRKNDRAGALEAVKNALTRNQNDPRFAQLLRRLQEAPPQ